jgi:hypothetical protein
MSRTRSEGIAFEIVANAPVYGVEDRRTVQLLVDEALHRAHMIEEKEADRNGPMADDTARPAPPGQLRAPDATAGGG